jgi:soluble lytic murein transglycosylase
MRRRLLHALHALGIGCGRTPLLMALVLVGLAQLGGGLELFMASGPVSTASVGASDSDFRTIDEVLTKRAPELGLTLRLQLARAVTEEAKSAGYDPLLILALIDVESDFQEGAVSNKGARGLMQIKPSTLYFLAQKEGLRLSREEVEMDPALCVRLGIRYLRELHKTFGHLDIALMAYNAGPARIRQALKEGVGDVFLRYPRAVRRDYRRFREGAGLGGDWALALRDTSSSEEAAAESK